MTTDGYGLDGIQRIPIGYLDCLRVLGGWVLGITVRGGVRCGAGRGRRGEAEGSYHRVVSLVS